MWECLFIHSFYLPKVHCWWVGAPLLGWVAAGYNGRFPHLYNIKKREREKKKSTRGRIVRVFLSVASWRVQLHQLLLEIDFGFVWSGCIWWMWFSWHGFYYFVRMTRSILTRWPCSVFIIIHPFTYFSCFSIVALFLCSVTENLARTIDFVFSFIEKNGTGSVANVTAITFTVILCFFMYRLGRSLGGCVSSACVLHCCVHD